MKQITKNQRIQPQIGKDPPLYGRDLLALPEGQPKRLLQELIDFHRHAQGDLLSGFALKKVTRLPSDSRMIFLPPNLLTCSE